MSGKIHIGTSGWNYKHWKKVFYPEDLPQKNWLDFFKDHLDTVEINNTFYNAPAKETFENWHDTVPDNFIFAVKANRYITHMKKLKDPENSLKSLEYYDALENNLGPVLIQLPPKWNFNEERLRNFADHLPEEFIYTMELRDQSWINEASLEILQEHNIAFCIYELGGYQSPSEVTADFVYIRLHGPERQKYKGKYSDDQLKDWAKQIQEWQQQKLDVYIYFDNDEQGFAVQNAMELRKMINS